MPFRALARLPLRHIWTTNYDTLPETAWRNERKLLDVKSRNEDLGLDKPWAHAILYKMHGSVDHPTDVVIAKDDYELYRRTRPGFLQVLTGHMVSKQILFLGFSFNDPNLAHLFGSIRESFQENGPEHYAIVRRPKRDVGPKAKRRFETETVRHALWVEDLKRYGIHCLEVDEYDEVDDVLHEVEQFLARQSVFVSGSFPDAVDPANADQRRFVEAVARGVGRLVAEKGKRLVSGFGLTVGSASIAGALGVVLQGDAPNLERSLLLRPFPREAPKGTDGAAFKRAYREGMLQQAGIAVFICGIKADGVVADGVVEEFESARRLKRTLIPIGATGGAAAELWKRVDKDFSGLWPPSTRKDFDLLNDRKQTPDALVAAVSRMIDASMNPLPSASPRRRRSH